MTFRCRLFYLFSIAVISGIIAPESWSQEKNPWKEAPEFYFLGYLDVFYAYDFNKPESSVRQPFFYNHNRHSEFNLNHGILGFEIVNPKYRAGFALHAGTYPVDNYSNEPGLLKNIYEAYIGFSLNQQNKATLFWKVVLIGLGLISLSTGFLKSPGFWWGYVLDIAGPARAYVLLRAQYKAGNSGFLTIRFIPEMTLVIIIAICYLIEAAQYLNIYNAHFDPYDFLEYISGILPVYLVDKLLKFSEN